MSYFTLGRVSLDWGPYSVTWSGDTVSFALDIYGSPTESAHTVANLRGLVDNNDDPVVPSTWVDDPQWDGFFRVDSVQLAGSNTFLDSGGYTARIAMTRVSGGWQTARREVNVQASRVAGSNYTPTPTSALPVSLLTVPFGDEGNVELGSYSSQRVSTTVEGDEHSNLFATPADADYSTLVALHSLPADNYVGAARVETQGADGAWRPVVGRQVLSGARWAIDNGYIRVERVVDGAETAERWQFRVMLRTGEWSSPTAVERWTTLGASYDPVEVSVHTSPVVMRNSPDTVVVRELFGASAVDWRISSASFAATCNLDLGFGVDSPEVTVNAVTRGAERPAVGDGWKPTLLGSDTATVTSGDVEGGGVEAVVGGGGVAVGFTGGPTASGLNRQVAVADVWAVALNRVHRYSQVVAR